jgi:ABC-type antimicrobial peptide transport system permease subunit
MRWFTTFVSKYSDAALMAVDALRTNKLRSFLTILGILIGVMTVIAMMSIIDGLNASFEGSVGELGTHNFFVQKYPAVSFGPDWFQEERKDFTIDDAIAIEELCPAVAAADISSWRFVTVEYEGERSRPLGITSTVSDYYDMLNDQYVGEGRMINKTDVRHARAVAVIGPEVVEGVFPGVDPIGRDIKIDGHRVEVIGVFEVRFLATAGTIISSSRRRLSRSSSAKTGAITGSASGPRTRQVWTARWTRWSPSCDGAGASNPTRTTTSR